MQKYHAFTAPALVPQAEPIPGKSMIPNRAGGFAFAVDRWKRLDRFLILGTAGGTYYASERDLTREALDGLFECIREDGERVVRRVVEVSEGGLAPKNDPALFVLALCTDERLSDPKIRDAAFAALPRVARIATHLFHFVAYALSRRHWRRSLRRAIGRWYLDRPANSLASQLTKYQSRDGWGHRDLIRLAHVKAKDAETNALLRYAARGDVPEGTTPALEHVRAVQKARTLRGAALASAIAEYGLHREHLPTEGLSDAFVWRALLDRMPIAALVRNLGKMSQVGLFDQPEAESLAVAKLTDQKAIQDGRLHPFSVLIAAVTYRSGRGFKGKNAWSVNRRIDDALDTAFDLSFKNVQPTGKRVLVAIDVSGSMAGSRCVGSEQIATIDAAAAMSVYFARAEGNVDFVAFDDNLYEPKWNARRDSLASVTAAVRSMVHGGTNCSLPLLYARQTRKRYDGIVILTDSETWQGSSHPSIELELYRREVNPQARLAVLALCCNNVSIADPTDAGQMDAAGLDASLPGIVSAFVAGTV